MSSSNLKPRKGKHRDRHHDRDRRRPSTSMTSASASQPSASKTKVQSPSGRRKLSFQAVSSKDSEVERPLKGKVFHLNVKRQQAASRLKEDLEYLGGTVDPFLNRDVWYLITDNIEAKESKGSSNANQSPASPAVSTPSPFHQTKGSVCTADSPSMAAAQESGPVTRGQAILQKAVKSQGGSSNVLANARNLGIHIYHVDSIQKYIAREKGKVQKLMGEQKSKGYETTKDSKPSTSRERRLTRPFLKYEDTSRHYRPVSKEFTSVPHVLVDTARGSCPFEPHPQRKENREQRAERNCDEGEAVPATAEKKSVDTTQKTPSNKAQSCKRHRDTEVKEKRRGYCECCAVKYDDLEKHLKSKQHLEFVAKQNSYVNLDRMIAEGPNIDQFLDDVMMYHEADSTEAQEIQQELDEVILVSSPYHKGYQEPKAKLPISKPQKTFAMPKSPLRSPVKQSKKNPLNAATSILGDQTVFLSPRTTKLCRRQRVSPRLLAGGPNLTKSSSIRKKSERMLENQETESSILTVDKLHCESRILPRKPPSSTESSLVCPVKKMQPNPLAKRSGVSCGRHGSRQSPRTTTSQETLKETECGRGKQSKERSNVVTDKKNTTEDMEKESASPSTGTRHKTQQTLVHQQATLKAAISVTSSGTAKQNQIKGITNNDKSLGSPSGRGKVKRRKVSHIPDFSEDDDVFEPDMRRFRTPGMKSGNFIKAGDSKKSRTTQSCSAGSIEHDGPNQRHNKNLLGLQSEARVVQMDSYEGNKNIGSRRKRKSEHVLEDELKRKLRSRAEPEAQQNKERKGDETKKRSQGKGDSMKSIDDFKEPKQELIQKSNRTAEGVKKSDKQHVPKSKGKPKGKVFVSAKQRRMERKQAIVYKLNHAQRLEQDSDTASEYGVRRSSRNNSALLVQDIDKVIDNRLGSGVLTIPSKSIRKSMSTKSVKELPVINAMDEKEPPSEPHLPSVFQSEGSAWNLSFLGFRSDEIKETEENFLNLSANLDLGMEQKLEQAALNVCCIPSSELELDQKSESSCSSSSVDLGDMSKVFQSLENFASEGSEWEAPVNEYFDKFDEVVQDLRRRTSELQALTPKSHLDKGGDGASSLKENLQKDTRNRNKLSSSEGNIADGIAEMPFLAAVEGVTGRRRSARFQDKDIIGEVRVDGITPEPTSVAENNVVPYIKSSGSAHFDSISKNSGTFKAPFPSPKRKLGRSNNLNSIRMSSSPETRRIITSTPRRNVCAVDEPVSPCISFPPGTPKEEQDIILEHYVHDETEAEVVFAKFSSPDRAGVVMSPVKYVVLNSGEISSPPVRQRSNISMSKDGFCYNITSPSNIKPDARKSLFELKRNTSLELKSSSPGSQQLLSPASSLAAFDDASHMNRSLSTPLSTSTLNKSPIFTFYTGNKKKRIGSYSMHKKSNFSSSILKPSKRGKHEQLNRQQPKAKAKKTVKSNMPRRSVSLSVSQNSIVAADEDIYEFVDEGGIGELQSSSRESPTGPKKNLVSVAIQTNEEDLEPDDTFRVRIPSSPVKQSPRKAQTLTLASFNPTVNLAKRVLPVEFWSY